ncbi:hypothetical protein BJY01DRAFT_34218 [Aspergillus pseudoustus]|uniref:non-specific serine/threonine protein kinase n=1 Tax=Aspergillus pseudoustus TaxID=1810923 RepID=A0ABR4JEU5_9EURO
MAEPEPIVYNWIRGVEALEGYQPGGYPVMVGDTLNDRYRVVDQLHSGGYSSVWLARDNHQRQYVALNVCTADAHPRETKVLRVLSVSGAGRGLVPSLLDGFRVEGPNGTHTCYTVTPAQCNLVRFLQSSFPA